MPKLFPIVLAAAIATQTGCRSTDPPDPSRARVPASRTTSPRTRTETARDASHVPVLVYHSVAGHHVGQSGEQRELDVDTGVFRRQMAYIAQQGRPVVSLCDLIDALKGYRTLPPDAVVITLDDGWQNQYEEAYPVLKQYGFTATFFIYTKAIGDGPGFMTWDEIRVLQAAGMTIGAHSRTHPVLTDRRVSLHDEIDGSRDDIERNLGVRPDIFAYPYGAWNVHVADAVRAAGFRGARALADAPVNTDSTVFEIRAVLATDDMQAFERAIDGHAP